MFSPLMSVIHVPVVTELKADDAYDVIFVIMRYTQLDSVMDALRANKTKNIVFVGNNVSARSLAASLPGKTFSSPLRFPRGIGRATMWHPLI